MMTNGNERLDRIEGILEHVAKRQEQFNKDLDRVERILQDMAARQQYHDDAFERFDAEMKIIREAQAIDSENIRALARIAGAHNRRLEDLEGGEAV